MRPGFYSAPFSLNMKANGCLVQCDVSNRDSFCRSPLLDTMELINIKWWTTSLHSCICDYVLEKKTFSYLQFEFEKREPNFFSICMKSASLLNINQDCAILKSKKCHISLWYHFFDLKPRLHCQSQPREYPWCSLSIRYKALDSVQTKLSQCGHCGD